jgi:hypothetical protein
MQGIPRPAGSEEYLLLAGRRIGEFGCLVKNEARGLGRFPVLLPTKKTVHAIPRRFFPLLFGFDRDHDG